MHAIQPALDMDLDNIQGSILAGFNTAYQGFVLLRVTERSAAAAWLATVVEQIATTSEVEQFNALAEHVRARRQRANVLRAMWTNIAFTCGGLFALGLPAADLSSFPTEFTHGRREGALAWRGSLDAADVHVVLIVGAETLLDLEHEIEHYARGLPREGMLLVGRQRWHARRPRRAPATTRERYGHGSREMVHAMEYVLGYDSMVAATPSPLPLWATDGAFLLVRQARENMATDTAQERSPTTALVETLISQAQQDRATIFEVAHRSLSPSTSSRAKAPADAETMMNGVRRGFEGESKDETDHAVWRRHPSFVAQTSSPDSTGTEDESLLMLRYRRTVLVDDARPRGGARGRETLAPSMPAAAIHDDYLFQPSLAALHFLATPAAIR